MESSSEGFWEGGPDYLDSWLARQGAADMTQGLIEDLALLSQADPKRAETVVNHMLGRCYVACALLADPSSIAKDAARAFPDEVASLIAGTIALMIQAWDADAPGMVTQEWNNFAGTNMPAAVSVLGAVLVQALKTVAAQCGVTSETANQLVRHSVNSASGQPLLDNKKPAR